MLQAQTQHVFSHQHQYPQADPSWMQHQQQQQHHQAQPHPHQSQQQHASLVAQQHAQVQAAAAAAQQQHYGRIAMSGNGAGNPAQGAGGAGMGGDGMSNAVSAMDGGISEENRKVFIWVAELLDPARRESALMELSKKREQVPELALVIWHSFGMAPFPTYAQSRLQ
jgi:CCR4-NOT transcription complex subunit 9